MTVDSSGTFGGDIGAGRRPRGDQSWGGGHRLSVPHQNTHVFASEPTKIGLWRNTASTCPEHSRPTLTYGLQGLEAGRPSGCMYHFLKPRTEGLVGKAGPQQGTLSSSSSWNYRTSWAGKPAEQQCLCTLALPVISEEDLLAALNGEVNELLTTSTNLSDCLVICSEIRLENTGSVTNLS